jgi:hypothetical protein
MQQKLNDFHFCQAFQITQHCVPKNTCLVESTSHMPLIPQVSPIDHASNSNKTILTCAQLDQLHRLVPELASTILILPFPPDFLPVGRRFGLDEIVDLGVAQFVDQLAGVSFVVVQIWQIVLAVDQLLFVMFYHGAFSHVALCQGTGKEKTEGRLE